MALIFSTSKHRIQRKFYGRPTLVCPKTVKGCSICLITLECGKQLTGEIVRIRSDLWSCAKFPAVKLEVELPKPMAKFFGLLPTVEELLCYNTNEEANMKQLKSVKRKPNPTTIWLQKQSATNS